MLQVLAIKQCSLSDELDTTAALLKIGEELGELNAAHINKLNLANKSASSSPNTLEEAVDVVLCALDYAFKDGSTIEQINQMIEKKVLKWELKIAKAKEARDAATIALFSQKLFQ